MRKFQGQPWVPRKGGGGPMFADVDAGPLPGVAQRIVPGETAGIPTKMASRFTNPAMLKAMATGAIGGLGGKAGMTSALVMNGIDVLSKLMANRKQNASNLAVSKAITGGGAGVDAQREKKGGKLKMKGRTTNTQKPNKMGKNGPAPKMAKGGMKKKGC